jgi:hypothetical protein
MQSSKGLSLFDNLEVGRWAAVVVRDRDSGGEPFGNVAGEDAIPAALRRRMGRMERLAVRCTLGALEDEVPTDELVFGSRYGNLETLLSLLKSLAVGEPMSPMGFSGSVHNAVPGLVGQIRKERLSHSAIAAGPNTFAATLLECCARLKTGECRSVTLTFADLGLPDAYLGFRESDEDDTGVAVALRLEPATTSANDTIAVRPGRQGVLDVVAGLKDGKRQLAFGEIWEGGA